MYSGHQDGVRPKSLGPDHAVLASMVRVGALPMVVAALAHR
jgi:hypothetical protein